MSLPRPKTTFELSRTINPTYVGGPLPVISGDGRWLFTALDDKVGVTDWLKSGERVLDIEGDSSTITTFSLLSTPLSTFNSSTSPIQTTLLICLRSLSIHFVPITLPHSSSSTSTSTTAPLPQSHLRPSLLSNSKTSNPTNKRKPHVQPKAHSSPIIISSSDPTGSLFATGSADGLVRVWNGTGTDSGGGTNGGFFVTHEFKGHGGVISCLGWDVSVPSTTTSSPTKPRARLLTGSTDLLIRIWDLTTHELLQSLEGHSSVPRGIDVISYSGFERWLSTVGRDGVANIYKLDEDEEEDEDNHQDQDENDYENQEGRMLTVKEMAARQKKKGSGKLKNTKTKKGKSVRAGGDGSSVARLVCSIPTFETLEAGGFVTIPIPNSNLDSTSSDDEEPKEEDKLLLYTSGSSGLLKFWEWDTNAYTSGGDGRIKGKAKEVGRVGDAVEEGGEGGGEVEGVCLNPSTKTLTTIHSDHNLITYSLSNPFYNFNTFSSNNNNSHSKSSDESKKLFSLPTSQQFIGFNDEIVDCLLMDPLPSLSSSSPSSGLSSSLESHLLLSTNSPLIKSYFLPTNSPNSTNKGLNVTLLKGHKDVVLGLANGKVDLNRVWGGRWLGGQGGGKRKGRDNDEMEVDENDEEVQPSWPQSSREQIGQVLVSGSKDRTARVWIAEPSSPVSSSRDVNWKCISIHSGHLSSIGAVALSTQAIGGRSELFSYDGTNGGNADDINMDVDGDGERNVGGNVVGGKNGQGGSWFVTASQDLTIKIWDLESVLWYYRNFLPSIHSQSSSSHSITPSTPPSLLTHKIHQKDINSLDISPDDCLIASGSQDKSVKVWRVEIKWPSRKEIKKWMEERGSRLSKKKKKSLKSDSTKEEQEEFPPLPQATLKLHREFTGHKRGVWSVKFSEREMWVASGSGDRTVRVWDLRGEGGGGCLRIFEGHTNSILRLNWLNHGTQLVSCGSDGLVKVWNAMKKDEGCLENLDGHEEKIWALAISKDNTTIVSAGADSKICFWKDVTEEKEREKVERKQVEIVKEQDYSNYLALKDYKNAIILALSMSQSRRLYSLFASVWESRTLPSSSTALSPNSITGSPSVDEILSTLSTSQTCQLLSFIRDWNTISKTSEVAQIVLNAIIRLQGTERVIKAMNPSLVMEELVGGSKAKGREASNQDEEREDEDSEEATREGGEKSSTPQESELKSLKSLIEADDLLESLIPFTKRHYNRMEKLIQDSYILDHTLAGMEGSVFSSRVGEYLGLREGEGMDLEGEGIMVQVGA